jgi:hypothetical protein
MRTPHLLDDTTYAHLHIRATIVEEEVGVKHLYQLQEHDAA